MYGKLRWGTVPFALILLASGPMLTSGWAAAQEREILFNQVTVSSAEASLVLELAGDEHLSVTFRDERILVDGEEVGRYAAGGELERSWRALLSQAVALENEALARLLLNWSPPAGAPADALRAARTVEERIFGALATAPAATPDPPRMLTPGDPEVQGLLELLVRDPDRLRTLTAAIRDLQVEGLRIHVGEEVRVGAGEAVEGSLLLLDGELVLDGTVEGDVVLLGGEVTLGEDARVGGDLRWSDARVEGARGAVRGVIREITPVAEQPEESLREQIRREIQEATAQALRDERRTTTPGWGSLVPRSLVRGIAGLFRTLITFAILMGAGLALLYFYPRNLEMVAQTASSAPGRAGAVGLAALVLAFPTWILGIVVLAVSIIGIPVMLLWLPAFPLALALAVALGFLAVARNLGRWVSGREIQGLGSLEANRPAVQLGAGLAILLSAFALAHVFQMGGPWFGIFRGLLLAAGVVLTSLVACVGLGAVLLSRGGRDPTFAGPGWGWGSGPSDPWAPEPDPFSPEPGPDDAAEAEPDAGDRSPDA